MQMKDNIVFLLDQAEALAKEKADGHLTIMHFTTHWKVMLGTPDLDTGKGREDVWKIEGYHTLDDALRYLLFEQQDISNY